MSELQDILDYINGVLQSEDICEICSDTDCECEEKEYEGCGEDCLGEECQCRYNPEDDD